MTNWELMSISMICYFIGVLSFKDSCKMKPRPFGIVKALYFFMSILVIGYSFMIFIIGVII